jgi:septal ring factor EnvC (AmiA/AmiB activator)
MREMLKTILVVASIAFLLGAFVFSGCTKHPNEEQLNTLEETKKAALTAEEQLAKKQQEKADFEKELAEKKQKLDQTKSEKEAISGKLNCQ